MAMRRAPPIPRDLSIPFIAVGYKGWKTEDALRPKAQELYEMFAASGRDHAEAPPVHVFQLDPPGFSVVVMRDRLPTPYARMCEPWRVVALLWSVITHNAQRFEVLPLNFAGYIKPDE
jgi:hypothetical protein